MPDEHTVDETIQQRMAWRRRLVEAIIERKFDQDTLVTMLMAGLDQAHADGLGDAADVCRDVAERSPSGRRVATILETALRRLIVENKRPAASATEMVLPTGIDPVSPH